MAVDGYMINGTAFVNVSTGSMGALELLGYTEAGVDENVKYNRGEILTDLFGPMTPQDWQDFGMLANLTAPLIAVDRAVLAKVMARGDATIGLLNTPGIPLGIGGYGFQTKISSTFDSAWSFNTCICLNQETRLATKANPFRLQLLAWPFVSYTATTGKNAPLWTRIM